MNPDVPHQIKDAWEQELGIEIPDDQWDHVLDLVNSSSICARHLLYKCQMGKYIP